MLHLNSKAQTLSPYVIASAGDYVVNGNVSLSYTIGEPMVQTLYSTKNILTQGFQQPMDTISNSSLSSVNEKIVDNGSPFSIEVYPNPFSDYIFIKVRGESNDKLTIELVNTLGQECLLPVVLEYFGGTNVYKVNTGSLAMGIYIVRVTSSNSNLLHSIKLNRTLY